MMGQSRRSLGSSGLSSAGIEGGKLSNLPAEERLAHDPTSELWGEHRARYGFAIRRLAGQSGLVLDVACGSGFGLGMLREGGIRAHGFDFNWSALATTRGIYRHAPVVRANATQLPLPDSCAHAVVSFETIEHVRDAEALVVEFARVLAPSGQLILSTPNRLFGPPELHAGNPFHVREFSGEELQDLLRLYFNRVTILGQRVDPHFQFVPFLMVDRHTSPAALAWKAYNRLPFRVKDRLARAWSGRSFYPGQADYQFTPNAWVGAHALLAVATSPRTVPSPR